MKKPENHFAKIDVFLGARKRSRIGVQRAEGFPASLRPRQDELWTALGLSMRELSRSDGQTLLHGDAHVGNTYRTRDGTVALADWQVVMRGGFAYDVADVIPTALTIEDPRNWERDLVAFYLERLRETGGSPPGFADTWDLYRRSLMYPFFCWATILGAPAWMPDTQPADLSRELVERVGTAIEDMDALNAF